MKSTQAWLSEQQHFMVYMTEMCDSKVTIFKNSFLHVILISLGYIYQI